MRALLVAFLLVFVGAGCKEEAPSPPIGDSSANPWQQPIVRPVDEGMSMTNRLEVAAGLSDPSKNRYLSGDRVAIHRRALSEAEGFERKSYYHQEYAKDLLNAGRSEEALGAFQAMESYLASANPSFLEEHKAWMLRKQAICYLRLGEQENCIANHHQHSCLFPVSGGGIHQKTRGSEGAIGKLQEWLELDPENREAQWFLNLAFMTLGTYPEAVPEPYRIAPAVFESEQPFPRFEEIARRVGGGHVGLSGGSVMEDFDQDGRLDIMCSGLGLREPLKLFRNQGPTGFEDVTSRAGLDGFVGGLNLVTTDYNNDGWVDVFVLRGGWFGAQGHHPNSLLKNNGDGTFEDVTEKAGLLSLHPTQTAVWFDFDTDGYLDVFIGNETSGQDRHPCELFRNNGDGTFTECAQKVGLTHYGMVKGVAVGDFDNDGRPDLYLSQGGQSNALYRNEGPIELTASGELGWHFEDVAIDAGVSAPVWSFPTWFWDYDNDGWLDLFVADYRMKDAGDLLRDYLGEPHESETARLYRNRGDGTFEDVSEATHLSRILFAMGCNYGDLDNDGYLDFYVGTGDPDLGRLIPNRMFRNGGGERFYDVTTAGGFGHLQKGHGVSFGDLDNDGDLDIYQDMGGAYSGDTYSNVLYQNPGFENQFIGLKLVGKLSNRLALGARLRVEIETEDGVQSIHRVASTGGSFGVSPTLQHIGLGKAKQIREIEVLWPSGGRTVIAPPVSMGQYYELVEGSPSLSPVERAAFRFDLSEPEPEEEADFSTNLRELL